MMLHKKSSGRSYWKLLVLLPIVGVTLALNAETVNDYVYQQPQKKVIKKGKKNATVKTGAVNEIVVVGYAPDDQKTQPVEMPNTMAVDTKEDKVFDVVEHMPEYPGGMEALMKYISMNVRYPKEAEEKNIQGRVIATFVVEKNGSISRAKVVKSVDPLLDEEALRVIYAMPNWIPGRQNGEPVAVKYTVPLAFRLQGNEKKEEAAQAANPVETKREVTIINGKSVLFIVDGETVSLEDFKTIDPKTIDHMEVLKEKSAIELYGEKAKDGVIIVTTKK